VFHVERIPNPPARAPRKRRCSAVAKTVLHTFDLFEPGEPRIGVVIGTGPSLTADQVASVSHLRTFGCNNAFEFGLDVHLACNWQWWDTYWPQIRDYDCAKWTTRPESAAKYGIHYIAERWEPGLSTDPDYICAHHGSGPQIVNLALHYGCKVMLLIGWDMRYAGKINRHAYAAPRHYFGEYPSHLQHWPMTGPDGELEGLIREMQTITPADYGVEIINCTERSAMRCFPYRSLSACLTDFELSRD